MTHAPCRLTKNSKMNQRFEKLDRGFLLLITLTLFSCFTTLVYAEAIGPREIWEFPPEELPPPPKPKNYTLEFAPEAYWFFYDEPSLSVDDKGVMYGARLAFTQRKERVPLVTRAEGRYAIGRVDYDGSLQDGTPHTTSGTDWTFEGQVAFGYDIMPGKTTVTPFVGVGYRYLLDNLESANAYERSIEYLYSPIGIEIVAPFGESWTWGMKGEYDLFWRGWVDSHLEDVNPSFNTVQNIQDSGFGARVALFLRRTINQKRTLSIEPFIRFWDIDDSNTAPLTFSGVLIGSGVEPANQTIESGLQVSIIY